MIFSLLCLLSFAAYAQERTPTTRVNQSIEFSDDLSFRNLDLAIDRQLASSSYQNLSGTIRFGTKTYKKTDLRDSLILLKEISAATRACMQKFSKESCMAVFNRDLNEKFAIYRPVPAKGTKGYRKANTTEYTSYYSPDVSGSRVRTSRFSRAIYALPTDSSDLKLTRVDIDYKGALDGKGLELFYVEDAFYDLYLLHVQGGGRIRVQNADGSVETRYLSFAGRNTHGGRMIYHYMKAKGYLKDDASIPAQRRFLEENPDKLEEVFGTYPAYIFFKETEEEPVGVDNIPLTEQRSLAIDTRIYKTTGLINFVKTVRPDHVDANGRVVKVPMSRFFIAQDTGGAIRGNARCDLYSGYGPQAELAAYNTHEMGQQFFLIKK